MVRSFSISVVGVALAVSASACTVEESPRDGGRNGDSGVVQCTETIDSDADGLADLIEGTDDTDGDGTPDARDTDSDDDGLLDIDESGALGLCTARDTDFDGIPDFRDNDSDNDGLADAQEREIGTDPTLADTDGDGFDDLAEFANDEADPRDPTVGIDPDDFYVILPYSEPGVDRELDFATVVRQADVFFLMDRTGSMQAEVDTLKSSLSGVVARMAESIPDIGVGFGGFAGFGGPAGGGTPTCILGICSYDDGPDGDTPFHLYSVITTDRDQMVRDVDLLDASQGGNTWASFNEALFQSATGNGVLPWVGAQTCSAVPDETGTRYGYPCFRPGSLPIMVVMTDTSSRNGPLTDGVSGGTYNASYYTMGPPPRTYPQTRSALEGIGARVIGVLSIAGSDDSCGPQVSNPTCREQFRQYALDTGSVDGSGEPLTFEIGCNGSGLGDSLVDAVRTLTEETPQNIRARTRDGDDFPAGETAVDARLFIKSITPVHVLEAGSTVVDCPTASRCDDIEFFDVRPGQRVQFNVHFMNDFVMPLRHAQVFRATIYVVGNGRAELDARDVTIVVPAASSLDLI